MIDRIRNEPALLSGLVVVLLNLGAAFGLDLTAEQTAAITATSAAVLAVLVRKQVTPTRKVRRVVIRGEEGPEIVDLPKTGRIFFDGN